MAKDWHKQGEKDSSEDGTQKRNIVEEFGNQIFGGKYRPPADKDDAERYKIRMGQRQEAAATVSDSPA